MNKHVARSFNDELQKTAILGHLMAGPIGHVLTNVVGRAAHHQSNLADMLAHKGLQHGLTGSSVNPL